MENVLFKIDNIISIIQGIGSYEEFGYYKEFFVKELRDIQNTINGDNYVITMGNDINNNNNNTFTNNDNSSIYDSYILQAKEVMQKYQNNFAISTKQSYPLKSKQIKIKNSVKIKNSNNNKLYDINYDAIIKNPETVIPNQAKIKQKASKIAEIVTMLNTNDELYQMLTQIFGLSLLDDLLTPNVSDNFVSQVEKAISKLQQLEINDNKNTIESYSHKKNINNRNIPMQKYNTDSMLKVNQKSYADELLSKTNSYNFSYKKPKNKYYPNDFFKRRNFSMVQDKNSNKYVYIKI